VDVRFVDHDQNHGPITAATLEANTPGWRKPIHTLLVNISGDAYNLVSGGGSQSSSSGNYGRVNVGTSATLIIAANSSRLACMVQNLGSQEVAIGFDVSLTIVNPGGYLGRISGPSGDGGVFRASGYTGPVYGVVASGSIDVSYMEF